jgi:hypothetical protein
VGHFLNPRHQGTFICNDLNYIEKWVKDETHKKMEWEANELASELLMPQDWVKAFLKQHSISGKLIQMMAEQACVSLTAMAICVVKLATFPMMVVYTVDHDIQWVSVNEEVQMDIGYDFDWGQTNPNTMAFHLAEHPGSVENNVWRERRGVLGEWVYLGNGQLEEIPVVEESAHQYVFQGQSHIVSVVFWDA